MKRYTLEELSSAETADKTTDAFSTLFEDMSPVSPKQLCTKRVVIFKLYGMNLHMDETAGKLIITNSI